MMGARALFWHDGVALLLDVTGDGFLQGLEVKRVPFGEEVDLRLGHALQGLRLDGRHCCVLISMGRGG